MNVRRATSGDEAVLKELWQAFVAELPEPDGFAAETWDVAWPALEADIEGAGVYLAEADGDTVGMLDASAAAGSSRKTWS